MTMGADPVACAALAGGADVKAFFVRKDAKQHGLARRVEGPLLDDDDRCLVVEDVVTTGGSTLRGDRGAPGRGPRDRRRRLGARPPGRRRRADRGGRGRALPARSRRSTTSTPSARIAERRGAPRVPRPGFEPGACSLGGSRSIQLSYRGARRKRTGCRRCSRACRARPMFRTRAMLDKAFVQGHGRFRHASGETPGPRVLATQRTRDGDSLALVGQDGRRAGDPQQHHDSPTPPDASPGRRRLSTPGSPQTVARPGRGHRGPGPRRAGRRTSRRARRCSCSGGASARTRSRCSRCSRSIAIIFVAILAPLIVKIVGTPDPKLTDADATTDFGQPLGPSGGASVRRRQARPRRLLARRLRQPGLARGRVHRDRS